MSRIIIDVEDHHGCAEFRQPYRNTPANARGASADQGNLIFERQKLCGFLANLCHPRLTMAAA
jgi:hypothetical protein